jgi:hypothetical protein
VVQFHPGALHNYNLGAKMALTHSHGTRVVVLKGSHRNQIGTVTVKGKIKTIILDKDNVELMGASDEMVRKL